MILWDRIKRSFDDGVEVVRRVAVTLSERARIESAVARLLIDKGGLETKRDNSCRALGGRVHYLWAEGADELLRDVEVREHLKDITDFNERIAEIKLKVQKVSLGEEAD